jgi:SAM-dependent methyltransferase
LCGDLERPPLREGSLDAVLCLNVLPHLADLDGSLRALRAALRPGGRFAVGHFLSSERLNELHRGIGGPVGGDVLPPARELGARLEATGCRLLAAEEQEDCYLVLGEAK